MNLLRRSLVDQHGFDTGEFDDAHFDNFVHWLPTAEFASHPLRAEFVAQLTRFAASPDAALADEANAALCRRSCDKA